MIEMIYKGNLKNGKQQERKSLPKNIRQIGEAGKEKRIYIEDYAATFLEGTDYAVLLGEIWQNGSMKCLFIDGALKVEAEEFGDDMWEKVYRDAKIYFEGKEILGWAKKTEEQEEEPEDEVLDMHREQFPGEDKVLVLHGPEGDNSVYLTESTGIKRQNGYCIYYEKNEQMQEYMIKVNAGKSVEAEEGAPDNAIRNFRKRLAGKRENFRKEEQTDVRTPLTVRFLYGASMFLVLTILVIGVTMVNNYNRMRDMEMTLSEMAQADTLRETEDTAALAANAQIQDFQTDQTSQPDKSDRLNQESEVQPDGQTESTQTNQSEMQESEGTLNGKMDETDSTESSRTTNRAAEASSAGVQRMQAEYTVREGDTLATVCRMYYGNLDMLEEICTLNDITDPNTILPGQKLVLP